MSQVVLPTSLHTSLPPDPRDAGPGLALCRLRGVVPQHVARVRQIRGRKIGQGYLYV